MMTLWIGQQTEAVNTRHDRPRRWNKQPLWDVWYDRAKYQTNPRQQSARTRNNLKINQLRRSHMRDDMKWNRTTRDGRRRLRLLFITEWNVERDATNLPISYFLAGVYCNKTKYDVLQLLQVVMFYSIFFYFLAHVRAPLAPVHPRGGGLGDTWTDQRWRRIHIGF